MVELLRRYNEHQVNVLRRRSEYDLARARERLHMVEGLIVGAVHADDIVKIFQAAKDRQAARGELIKRFRLSEIQAQKISDMTLAQVTRLDLASYRSEKKDLLSTIAHLEDLLAHEPKMVALITEPRSCRTHMPPRQWPRYAARSRAKPSWSRSRRTAG
jgi:DNA gyrase subunit A